MQPLFDGLHRDVSVCLEDHQGKGTTGLDVSENEFSEHIQTNLSIGNCLNDSNGKGEGKRDSQSEQEGPPC